jgi:hypothetical protein
VGKIIFSGLEKIFLGKCWELFEKFFFVGGNIIEFVGGNISECGGETFLNLL